MLSFILFRLLDHQLNASEVVGQRFRFQNRIITDAATGRAGGIMNDFELAICSFQV